MKDEYREETNLDVYSNNSKGSYSDEYVKWLESKVSTQQQIIEQLKVKELNDKSNDLWKMLNKINGIMWESHMVKDREFGSKQGDEIMDILEQWATKY